MIKFNFPKYIFTLIFIGFLTITVIELFSIPLSGFLLYGNIIQYVLAQPQSTNTSIVNSTLEEQDEPKIIIKNKS